MLAYGKIKSTGMSNTRTKSNTDMPKSSICWSQFNAVNRRTSLSLCEGEARSLSEQEIAEINRMLGEMDKLSVALYNHLDVARARFRLELTGGPSKTGP